MPGPAPALAMGRRARVVFFNAGTSVTVLAGLRNDFRNCYSSIQKNFDVKTYAIQCELTRLKVKAWAQIST